MKILISAIAAMILAFSTTVFAAEEGQTRGQGMEGTQKEQLDRADRNGDGKLDKEEALAAGIDDRTFEKLDTNGDGELSKEEYKKHKETR